ncbi:hypothetical protein E2553_24615 [Paraburkholderia dipogonis]|uniref:PIN domain-containing protein n=1 Tax=Paraburkholderia dipogonis TaxID=1211383 RepID=A0A4Y8MRE4_9BURK|nr:hypothetical protein [Paraburkholderia dipogonis]TFE39978.1 hypothetical protein E2553_24615 [Paraburkholderia dipogonis]
MILLDNDVLLKLASYDLIDEALKALDVQRGQVSVLSTAKYSLLPAKNRLQRCKDEETANRLEAFLKTCPVVSQDAIAPELLDELTNIQSLDSGEAVLFAFAASNRDAVVVTGDKRAISALMNARVAEDLQGRVMALESLFEVMTAEEVEPVQAKVRAKPAVDKTLSNVFGKSYAASAGSVREGLASYINHMKGQTGGLLWRPPD